MVIMGGYKDKMNRLMRFDPGLQRRFPKRLHLNDYSALELAQIMSSYSIHQFEKSFHNDLTLVRLETFIKTFHSTKMPKFNAGLAVELVEQAVQKQTVRIGRTTRQFDKDKLARKLEIKRELSVQDKHGDTGSDEESKLHQLPSSLLPCSSSSLLRQPSSSIDHKNELIALASILTPEDFSIDLGGPKMGDKELIEQVEQEINQMVGLTEMKEFFKRLKRTVEYVERGGNPRILKQNLNLILTGNPGTGKTTMARLMAKYLHALGVLPYDRFVEKNGLELKGMYVGHTSHVVKEAVADAMGGCLFVDEAYALVDRGGDRFSGEAVRMLLTELENNRGNVLVIMAGYANKMSNLMNSDPGMPRRFAKRMDLPDYNCDELSEIAARYARKINLTFDVGLQKESVILYVPLVRIKYHNTTVDCPSPWLKKHFVCWQNVRLTMICMVMPVNCCVLVILVYRMNKATVVMDL